MVLVMTSCRLGEMSGGFGEASYDQLWSWRDVWSVWWNWFLGSPPSSSSLTLNVKWFMEG